MGRVPGCCSPHETTDNWTKRPLRTDLALNSTSLDIALQRYDGDIARLGSRLLEEGTRTPSYVPRRRALLLGPGSGGTVTPLRRESPDGCRQPGRVAASSRVW